MCNSCEVLQSPAALWMLLDIPLQFSYPSVRSSAPHHLLTELRLLLSPALHVTFIRFHMLILYTPELVQRERKRERECVCVCVSDCVLSRNLKCEAV